MWLRNKKTGGLFNTDDIRKSNKTSKNNIENTKSKTFEEWKEYLAQKYGKFDFLEGKVEWDGKGTPLVEISDKFKNVDSKLLDKQLNEFERLREKYGIEKDKGFKFDLEKDKYNGKTDGTNIIYSESFFKDHNKWLEKEIKAEKDGWHTMVADNKKDTYIITHEFGHILEKQLASKNNIDYDTFNTRFMVDVYDELSKKTGILTINKMADKYISKYGRSKEHEDFAETFVKYEIGKKDEITEAFEEILNKYNKGRIK